MAEEKLCGWGIMGTAKIARKNIIAMNKSGFGEARAVASRSPQKAEEFAKETGVPLAFGSYEELLLHPHIDAIYLPLPSAMHLEWVKKIAKAGKHVLCEKPCAPNSSELREMLAACEENRVMFMDGVMFMHHLRLRQMRDTIDRGVIGASGARHVFTDFTFRGSDEFFLDNVRIKADSDPLGCVGDLAWYNIRFTLWAFNYDMPILAQGTILDQTDDGVPISFTGQLIWADDETARKPHGKKRTAQLHCSFSHYRQQIARISGDDGVLFIDDGSVINADPSGSEFKFASEGQPPVTERVGPFDQTVAMWESASKTATSGKFDSFWPRVALQTQLCLDSMLESARNGGALVSIPPL